MNEHSLDRYYEVLELGPEATIHDLERAYRLLRRIYNEPTTGAGVPGLQEFSETRRKEILREINRAYEKLRSHMTVHRSVPSREIREVEAAGDVTGGWIQSVRESIPYSLEDVAEKINIRKTYILAIENERFQDLPDAAVYVRGFVRAYLQFLGVKEEPALESYMRRYRNWSVTR